MLSHVLVAYDGSAGAEHALAFARKLLGDRGRLTVIRAIEVPIPYVVGGFDGVVTLGELPTLEELEADRHRLRAKVADLPDDRVTVRVELGHPVDVVLKAADEFQPELVVVGARGMGSVTRFLVGSVSDRIVHHCSRPVAVVR